MRAMSYPDQACVAVMEGLEAISLDFLLHVPDSFDAPVIAHFENSPTVRAFPVAKDEEGIGRAFGLAMAGRARQKDQIGLNMPMDLNLCRAQSK